MNGACAFIGLPTNFIDCSKFPLVTATLSTSVYDWLIKIGVDNIPDQLKPILEKKIVLNFEIDFLVKIYKF